MAPGEDVERGRASSAAERQKSIVSMTEFEGMDEYTALQKYILFYRDPRAAGHHQEEAPKKKKWWQSGGGKAAGGADLAAEVPEDCKFSFPLFNCTSDTSIGNNGYYPTSCIRICTDHMLCWMVITTPSFGGALHSSQLQAGSSPA